MAIGSTNTEAIDALGSKELGFLIKSHPNRSEWHLIKDIVARYSELTDGLVATDEILVSAGKGKKKRLRRLKLETLLAFIEENVEFVLPTGWEPTFPTGYFDQTGGATGGGGVSNLVDLNDVDASQLAEGAAIIYDLTTGKFIVSNQVVNPYTTISGGVF